MKYHLEKINHPEQIVCRKRMDEVLEDGDTIRDDFTAIERPMEMCDDCLARDLDRQIQAQIEELKGHGMLPRAVLLHSHGIYAARRHLANEMHKYIGLYVDSLPIGFKGYRWRDLLVFGTGETEIWLAEVWGRPRREGEVTEQEEEAAKTAAYFETYGSGEGDDA